MPRLPLTNEQAETLERWTTIEAGGKLEPIGLLNDDPDELLSVYGSTLTYVRLVEGLRAGDVPPDTLQVARAVAAEWVDNFNSGVDSANRAIEQVREGDPVVLDGESPEVREREWREEAGEERRRATKAGEIRDLVSGVIAAKEAVSA